jgi:hypothetical protein
MGSARGKELEGSVLDGFGAFEALEVGDEVFY